VSGRYAGLVALVTGPASGIGAATVAACRPAPVLQVDGAAGT
jgi:NAD(P)-dependent dehydrogenase (short-subunit alcohol dehydrogenase family)